MFFLLFGFCVVYFLYKVADSALPHLFLVPPHNWQDKIKRVLESSKPIYLNVGVKRSCYRKRLVGASSSPSFYTNFVQNKIIVLPLDIENKDEFTEALTRRDAKDPLRSRLYGFFHPYANNGGGGEKVLWEAVHATLLHNEHNIAIVYTTNIEALPKDILAKVRQKFGIEGIESRRVVFVYLRKFSKWIDAGYWKHFTLIGQTLGSILLAFEALYELSPDVWIDTMGLPGSYLPVSVILKIPIVAYVHYPIIQPDMFNMLKFKQFSDLTRIKPSLSDARDAFKLFYWSALYNFYKYLGSRVDLTFANGTWTYNHIRNIWSMNLNLGKTVDILYPPCFAEKESGVVSSAGPRENKLLFIAQFRPEKRHSLILDEYNAFLKIARKKQLALADIPKVVFLGSCRTQEDSGTLTKLREQVEALDLRDYVEFIVDSSFEEMKEQLSRCKFGLNAMWNEHFGIGVVEYISAGVVPLVHASAGPLLDICTSGDPSLHWENDVGFFFKSRLDPDFEGEELDGDLVFLLEGKQGKYPSLEEALDRLFIEDPKLSSEESLLAKREVGRELMVKKFSNEIFVKRWIEHLGHVEQLEEEFRVEKRGKVEAVY